MEVVSHLKKIFLRFKPNSEVLDFELLTTGNINKTYLVKLPNEKFILQRINNNVFSNPDLLMKNLNEVMTSFASNPVDSFLPPLSSSLNSTVHIDEYGFYWRVFPFVKNYPISVNSVSLKQVGFAYGNFLKDLSNVDSTLIQPTIPNFHELDFYYKQFVAALNTNVKNRSRFCKEEIEFIKSNQHLVKQFQSLSIPKRLTHNDAKLDNILFENLSLTKWKVIDYDTVMLGYAIFDYGDLVRSTCSLMNESATSFSDVVIDKKIVTAIKEGFLLGASKILSVNEIKLLDKGVLMIVYEQAIRFLNDYLNGDVYYRIEFSDENLVRAKKHLWMLRRMITDF